MSSVPRFLLLVMLFAAPVAMAQTVSLPVLPRECVEVER